MKRYLLTAILVVAMGLFFGSGGLAYAQDELECNGDCGCMDIVLVVDHTGSMAPAIDNVIAGLGDIIAAAEGASIGVDGDPDCLRMGVVSFNDVVVLNQELTSDLVLVGTAVTNLFAVGGAGEPEASDEALLYVVSSGTGADPGEWGDCVPPTEPVGAFREDCDKVVVLVTDATPGGCDDAYADGVDDLNADAVANLALGANVLISAVLVDNGSVVSGAHPGGVEPDVMSNYADVSGGVFITVPASGEGTGAAIGEIIEDCGEEEECCPECPEWPECCTGEDPRDSIRNSLPDIRSLIRSRLGR